MSVIWSGVTEEGAVVPVQVTAEGKVVAVGDGPEGDYLKLTGGNLTGDLTVNEQIELNTDGSITAAGDVKIGGLSAAPNITLNATNGSAEFSNYVNITRASNSNSCLNVFKTGIPSPTIQLLAGGGAKFADDVIVGSGTESTFVGAGGGIVVRRAIAENSTNSFMKLISTKSGSDVDKAAFRTDGSALFSGGACGFTSSGELYFTSRGTRYKLFVSQGLVQAEEYTRQMELKEKSEQFIADKRETKPSEPKPKPLGLQPEVTLDNDNA